MTDCPHSQPGTFKLRLRVFASRENPNLPQDLKSFAREVLLR